jgi:zinc transport system substrate-binding protein
MSRNLFALSAGVSLSASLMAGTALADAPRVAVDIAPVHSLVARVMDGVGAPDLIVQPGGSPHEYSLRPSEAAALQEADIVVWIGPDLTPWLASAVGTLAGDAMRVTLMESEGTELLEFREGALFEAHAHGEAEEEHDHDHDHDHDDAHDDHGHDEHAHGAHDPHAWLSPANAAVWLDVIAARLSAADPANAATYAANAAAARAELDAVVAEVNAMLDPVRDLRFVVFHDAYQYFETAFDIPASGAITLSDATDPSPARIAEIQGRVAEQGIACVLSEPQFDPGIVATVMEGTPARTAVLDPLGSDLAPGPGLYPQLLRNLATALSGCL